MKIALAYTINMLAYIIFFLLFYVTLSHAQTATPTATPTCVPNGLACVTNSQCCSNYCNTGSIFPLCQAVLTPTASSTPPFIPTPTPSPRPTPRPEPTSRYPTATATAPRPTPTPNPICNLPQSNFGTLTVGCPVIPSGTKGSVNAYDGTDCPFYNNGTPICSSGGGVHQYTATLFLPLSCASCTLATTPTLIYTTLGPFGPAASENVTLHAVVNLEWVELDSAPMFPGSLGNTIYFELDSSINNGSTWVTLQSYEVSDTGYASFNSGSFSVFTELTLTGQSLMLRLLGSTTSSDSGTILLQNGSQAGTGTNTIWAQIFTID